jgi:hypothetical protein
VSYLNCPACHLSLRAPRASFMAPEHCPRCLGRRQVATPLFESPVPIRRLIADEGAAGIPAPPADQPQP